MFWKTSKAQKVVYSQNSNNNNLPTRAIFRQQSCLYNKHLYTTAMATSLKWPSLYNDQLFTMVTSLYNGYYSTKANCLYDGHLSTTASSLQWPNLYNGLSLIWPPLYNGFFALQFNLSTMATSLQPKRPPKVSQMPGEELSDSLGLAEPPVTLFFNLCLFCPAHMNTFLSSNLSKFKSFSGQLCFLTWPQTIGLYTKFISYKNWWKLPLNSWGVQSENWFTP